MENTNGLGFFERTFTKEEWTNPDLLKFHNHDISVDNVNLLDGLDELLNEFEAHYIKKDIIKTV